MVEHLTDVLEERDVMTVGNGPKVWVEVTDAHEIAAVKRLNDLDVAAAHQSKPDDCQLHRGHISARLQQIG